MDLISIHRNFNSDGLITTRKVKDIEKISLHMFTEVYLQRFQT